jgi:hypothetical protein
LAVGISILLIADDTELGIDIQATVLSWRRWSTKRT